MNFSPQQHRKMAGLLHQKALKETDPTKSKKQLEMAKVFRLLATKAEKNK
jgi:hypothetical protein